MSFFKMASFTLSPTRDMLTGLDGPTRDLLTGGVTTGVVLQLNGIGMAPDIANPFVVAKQHLEHPVPHYLMERQEEESTIPKKKRKRNGRHIEATDSGFLKKGRMQYRIDNGSESLVTQHKEQRTCVQDALYQSLVARGVDVTIDEVRAIYPTDENCPFSVAQEYVKKKFNLKLECVTSQFKGLKGGEELAMLQRRGCYLVQVLVFRDNKDPTPVKHCVFYSGSELLDNQKNIKPVAIEESDRQDAKSARAVFQTIAPKLNVRIANVYQLF